jgi:hypothetical protein
MLSGCIQHDLSFLATIKLFPGPEIESAKGHAFEIPAFNWPSDDALQIGENKMRYLLKIARREASTECASGFTAKVTK